MGTVMTSGLCATDEAPLLGEQQEIALSDGQESIAEVTITVAILSFVFITLFHQSVIATCLIGSFCYWVIPVVP